MSPRRLRPVAGLAVLLLLLGGCGASSARASHKQVKTHKSAAKGPASTGTPIAVDGYTAYLPAGVLADTPGVAAALTPYGLVWSTYADAVDEAGSFMMPHPYAIEVSPSPGSGPLAGSGRLIAEIPASVAGQAADLHFVGATGPYLGFTLDIAGSATTLDAGLLDLLTGKVTMLPAGLTTNAGVVVGGGRMGILAPTATYVFDPGTDSVTAYPIDAGTNLWADLAYGQPVGSADVPDPVEPGVTAYAAGSSLIYAPPGWRESSEQLGGDFTIWRIVDPADPAAFVEVETAPCVGCSVVSLTAGALPAPQVTLPDGTGTPDVTQRWLTDYAIGYQGTAPGYHYPVWGLAIAPRPGQSGFEEVVVTLPASESKLADAIIASYPLPR